MTRRLILVRPPAEGGLHAHMRDEARVLESLGIPFVDAGPVGSELGAGRPFRVNIPSDAQPLAAATSVVRLRRLFRLPGADGGARPQTLAHAHGVRAGALACLASLGTGVDVIVTLHNAAPDRGFSRALSRALHLIVARRATRVLAVSPDLADAMRALGAKRVERAVVPGGETIRGPFRPNPEGPPTVLVIARLAPQKGLGVLLDAVGTAAKDPRWDPRIRVLIAGEGPLRDHLRHRIDTDRLPVVLLGRRGDVSRLLRDATLVVQASHWEGQPVFMQEALRAGKAIIATDAGGTRWVTGDAAELVPPRDAPALARALVSHLMGDAASERRARLEKAATKQAGRLPTRADLEAQLVTILDLNAVLCTRKERS